MNTALQTSTELTALNFKLANKRLVKYAFIGLIVMRLIKMKESRGMFRCLSAPGGRKRILSRYFNQENVCLFLTRKSMSYEY